MVKFYVRCTVPQLNKIKEHKIKHLHKFFKRQTWLWAVRLSHMSENRGWGEPGHSRLQIRETPVIFSPWITERSDIKYSSIHQYPTQETKILSREPGSQIIPTDNFLNTTVSVLGIMTSHTEDKTVRKSSRSKRLGKMGLSLTDHKTNMYLKKEHKLKNICSWRKTMENTGERELITIKINTYKTLETVPGTRYVYIHFKILFKVLNKLISGQIETVSSSVTVEDSNNTFLSN